MKNNSLDDIVKCNIEISSPVSNDTTFDSILLVVPAPTGTGTKSMDKTTAVSKADELLDFGFTVDDAAYAAAAVAFSQSPSPNELYICIRAEVGNEDEQEPGGGDSETQEPENGDSGTEESGNRDAGTEESVSAQTRSAQPGFEDIRTTLARANMEAAFYGIHITEFREPEDLAAAIAWAEANEKMLAFEYHDYNNCPVKNFSYYRSFGMYAGEADGYSADKQPAENRYAALAWMAKCFGYDPGTETWHLKELAAIVPSALGTDQKKEMEKNHINTFLRYAGCNCTIGGYTLAGEWIDVIRFRDWLKAEMQINVLNALKANRKVPFTDGGIGLIEGKMEETLKKGQDIGGIAPTAYGTDGDTVYGYTVVVPRASDLTEAERKSRKLTGCHYTARLAGAIHAVEIEGFLTF